MMACHLNVIMTNIKYLLTIKENSAPGTIYISLHTKRKNLYWLRSRIHPFGNYVDRQEREPFIWRGEEDNFEWRQTIERRQLASERQLKALLQETERLREENVVLRIQASTSEPPRRQRSRGQVANSRPEPESIYPGQQELS
ncbi:hypothetical protein AAG906_009651 [Vitis piasezkii]